jgi:hypothetical protein
MRETIQAGPLSSHTAGRGVNISRAVRIFIPVPPFTGPFDIEIDCVATLAPT